MTELAQRRWRVPPALYVAAGSTLFFLLAWAVLTAALQRAHPSICVWDCVRYGDIAADGYPRGPDLDQYANFGFFPGFPLSVALAMRATGLDFALAGVLLNAIYSLAFAWVASAAWRELQLGDEAAAVPFVAAFLLSPFGLYNHVPYSEMLFNLSALITFVAWKRENYLAAAVAGVVLTATRLTGVFLPVVLMTGLIVAEHERIGAILLRPDARFRALAVMPLGAVAFILFLAVHVGDPLAYLRVQYLAWGQALRNPLDLLLSVLSGGAGWSTPAGLAAFAAAAALLAVGAYRKLVPRELASFAILAPALSLMSTTLGQQRYALALFPVYLLVARLPQGLQIIVLAVFAVGQAVFLSYWLTGSVAVL